MRAEWLVVTAIAATGCGRLGFDPATGDGGASADAIGPATADADPTEVFAGTCTTAATQPVMPVALVTATETVDGVMVGGDYGDLRSFRFADGRLEPIAATTINAVDGMATDRTGGNVVLLDEQSGTAMYTIVDRSLVGSPYASIPGMRIIGTNGMVAAGERFAVLGLSMDASNTPLFAFTGTDSTLPVVSGFANTVPALTAIPGGFLAVMNTSPGCRWRWLDTAGALTGEGIDDSAECQFPGVWPDSTGATVLVTWTQGADVFARVRDLASHNWLSPELGLGTLQGEVDALASGTAWMVSRPITGGVDVIVIAPDGTITGPLLEGTGNGGPMMARLMTIADQAYLVWIMAVTNGERILHVQPICSA